MEFRRLNRCSQALEVSCIDFSDKTREETTLCVRVRPDPRGQLGNHLGTLKPTHCHHIAMALATAPMCCGSVFTFPDIFCAVSHSFSRTFRHVFSLRTRKLCSDSRPVKCAPSYVQGAVATWTSKFASWPLGPLGLTLLKLSGCQASGGAIPSTWVRQTEETWWLMMINEWWLMMSHRSSVLDYPHD